MEFYKTSGSINPEELFPRYKEQTQAGRAILYLLSNYYSSEFGYRPSHVEAAVNVLAEKASD